MTAPTDHQLNIISTVISAIAAVKMEGQRAPTLNAVLARAGIQTRQTIYNVVRSLKKQGSYGELVKLKRALWTLELKMALLEDIDSLLLSNAGEAETKTAPLPPPTVKVPASQWAHRHHHQQQQQQDEDRVVIQRPCLPVGFGSGGGFELMPGEKQSVMDQYIAYKQTEIQQAPAPQIVSAWNQVYAALNPLPQGSREKVLKSVAELFGVGIEE